MRRLLKFLSGSLLVGVLASLVVWYGWGWHELARMLLQVVLTVAFGVGLLSGIIEKLHAKIKIKDLGEVEVLE